MGLAWTFLDYSKGYNYFMEIAEAGGGLLLLFRQTAIAGVLLSLIVTCNIVPINLCFDIPVKLVFFYLAADVVVHSCARSEPFIRVPFLT